MHRAPWAKTSISMGEFAQMYRISSRLSSRLSTTRFMPMAAHSCTPGREWMVICVEP